MNHHHARLLSAVASFSAVCSLTLVNGPALAQDRPISLVVPFAAGGVTDVGARIVATELAKQLNGQVIVENRVGAGGRVGAEAIMRGAKDGSVIGIINSGLATNLPLMSSDFKIQPGKDYQPISRWFEAYVVVVAGANLPFNDVKGLVDYAKANSGKLNWGSAGVGTTSHLGLELLKHLTGTNIVHVAYKGDAQVTNDLLGGQIQLAISSAPIKPHIDAKKLKGIGTTGAQRWDLFPDLPTMEEAGIKGFNLTVWQGFIGPTGLAPATLERLNRGLRATLAVPDTKRKLEDLGLKIAASSPDEFATYIRADLDRWAPVIKAANIKLD